MWIWEVGGGRTVIENEKLYKNRIATDIDFDINRDEDGWCVQNVTIEQRREGRDLVKIKIWRINNMKTGSGRWAADRVA